MNDFEQLDERAHLAADDLRSRAAARPRPAFDPADASLLPAPARIGDHRSRRSFLAAAAVILLVLAAGLALVVRHQGDSDDKGPADTTTTTEPPRPFVATALGGVMAFGGVVDQTKPDGRSEIGTLQIYGPSIDRPELGVGLLTDESNDYSDTKKVEIDGRTVLTADDAGLGRRVVIVRRGKRAVLAMSPVLDRATLADVAEGAEVDGTDVQVPGGVLSKGFDLLTHKPNPLGPSGAGVLRGGPTDGSVAVYLRGMTGDKSAVGSDGSQDSAPAVDDSALVTVTSTAGDEARLEAARLWADDVSETTVRGHRALVTATSMPGPTRSGPVIRVLTWLERPGELLRVSGYGVSIDELTTTAEGVRPVGPKEWADLVERTKLGEFSDASDASEGGSSAEVGRGRFADGTAWRLAVEKSGSTGGPDPKPFVTPSLSVALGGDSASSSGSASGAAEADGAFVSNVTLDQGGRHFAAGFVDLSVDAVELRRGDGSVIERAQMVEGGGYRAWVAELTDDPTVIVALAVDGRELDRVTFSNLDENESPEVSEESATTIVGSVDGGGAGENPQTTVPDPAPPALPDN